jgi:hypothetical protein
MPLLRWAGLTAMGWVVSYLVLSSAAVVFTGPPSYGLLFGLAGMMAALSDPRSDPQHRSHSQPEQVVLPRR